MPPRKRPSSPQLPADSAALERTKPYRSRSWAQNNLARPQGYFQRLSRVENVFQRKQPRCAACRIHNLYMRVVPAWSVMPPASARTLASVELYASGIAPGCCTSPRTEINLSDALGTYTTSSRADADRPAHCPTPSSPSVPPKPPGRCRDRLRTLRNLADGGVVPDLFGPASTPPREALQAGSASRQT